jgi:hypothetical protein
MEVVDLQFGVLGVIRNRVQMTSRTQYYPLIPLIGFSMMPRGD